MKKLRDSRKVSGESLDDQMLSSWDGLKDSLASEGWAEPSAALTDADGSVLVGERIYVMGMGIGEVTEFVHSRVGASKHVIELEDGPRTETVCLRRKGNDKTPFLVRSVMAVSYRRRRDNLTHREPWSKAPGSLSRQLSADEANSMWVSHDSSLDEEQTQNMFNSMDDKGRITPRANQVALAPGEQLNLQLQSQPRPKDRAQEGEKKADGSPKSVLATPSPTSARAAHAKAKAGRSMRLADTRAGQTASIRGMSRSAPAASSGMRVKLGPEHRPEVATSKHRCKLVRKDWEMQPGMGLYCDACERLCRAYGEWFSWNCPSCDFDMCNKCLEESRNSWAVLPLADQAPQHSSSLLCNIKGSWTLCPSGIENEDEPEQQLEIVAHDLRTGMVRAVHRPFGELRGRLEDGELLLIKSTSADERAEPEPEPEPEPADDSGGARPQKLRCLAQVLETADRSGWIIVGQWQNLPGASTPDEVRFIAHPNHAARAPSPVSSATSSDLSSAEEEEEEEEEEAEPDSTEESDSSSDSGGEDSTKPSA